MLERILGSGDLLHIGCYQGARISKLLYREWISNKVLLYNIRNYIQYPVTNHNRKGYGKECVYVYTHTHTHTHSFPYGKLRHFAAQNKLSQPYKSIILQ